MSTSLAKCEWIVRFLKYGAVVKRFPEKLQKGDDTRLSARAKPNLLLKKKEWFLLIPNTAADFLSSRL